MPTQAEYDYWYAIDPVYAYLLAQQAWLDEQGGLNIVVQTTPVETDANATVIAAPSGGGPAVPIVATSYDYPVSGIADLAWAQHPYRVLWFARSDGLLGGLTMLPEQQIYAWHRHPMVNGAVESVAVIPSPSESSDRVWAVTRREIQGEQVRYIEYMTAPYEPASRTDTAGFCHLDSSIVYDGAPADVITGLDHLEGQTVSVWGDGVDQGDYEVADGEITLSREISFGFIGIHSPARIVLLPLATAPGQKKVIERTTVRLAETGGLAYASPTAPDMKRAVALRRASDAQDITTPLVTGDVTFDLDSGWESSGQMALGAIRPYPSTILGVFCDVHVAER